MSKHVLLNNIEHKNIKIQTGHSETLGDNIWFTQTFPQEFRAAQCCYPIFFQKDSQTGKFFAITLFGFESGENLFLSEKGWNAAYIPLMVDRQPFSIGQQRHQENEAEKAKFVVNLDLEHSRVNTEIGQSLFSDLGENSAYLERVIDILYTIHQGIQESDPFIDTLLKFDLLEPFIMSVTLNDGSVNELIGFYTINEDNLVKLSAEAIIELHSKKYLEPIYMVLASHSHVNYLIEEKNKKLVNNI